MSRVGQEKTRRDGNSDIRANSAQYQVKLPTGAELSNNPQNNGHFILFARLYGSPRVLPQTRKMFNPSPSISVNVDVEKISKYQKYFQFHRFINLKIQFHITGHSFSFLMDLTFPIPVCVAPGLTVNDLPRNLLFL